MQGMVSRAEVFHLSYLKFLLKESVFTLCFSASHTVFTEILVIDTSNSAILVFSS